MKCPNCHAENNDGTLFCIECGAFLNPENPNFSSDEEKDEITAVPHNQEPATIADMEALLREIGMDINSDKDYNRLSASSGNKPKKIETEKHITKPIISPEPSKKSVIETNLPNNDKINNQDDKVDDDDDDDFEHTKHNLKVVMAVLSLIAVMSGIIFGIISFSTQQNQKKELSTYVLMLNNANELVDLGNYTAAEEAYKNVISYNPSLSAAYYGLSKVYTLIGDNKNAKLILEQGYLNTGDPLLL